MNPEVFAKITLVSYALLAVIVIGYQVWRCRFGPTVWWLYAANRLYVAFFFHWRANRHCPFPESGPALVLANHRSPVDPLLIWMNHHLSGDNNNIRPISFLMAKEYYEMPSLKWLCRAMQSIPTERDGQDMAPAREALRRLKNGQLVGLFPEGRINLGEGLLEANSGVAWLALRAQVLVFPVFVHNAPQGSNMVQPFYTRSRVRVTYGDPIDLSRYRDKRKTHELLHEVTEYLMSRLSELNTRLPIDDSAGHPTKEAD